MNARDDTRAAVPDLDVVALYHERTKHSLGGYARGPETLDWDAQPNPFREFAGSPRLELGFGAGACEADFALACEPGKVAPAPLNALSLATLLELSVGLSAWKQFGPDRWALRCNPSSGNLHPTESYVLCRGIEGVADGLHHYLSRDHALELRRADASVQGAPGQLWIGLSSIAWREAWKYGERAFRYCQLDIGHALGGFRYAAAALGWRATALTDIAAAELARMMGLDRAGDFQGAEREDAELLIAVETSAQAPAPDQVPLGSPEGRWTGRANRLDAHPLYRWPIIDDVGLASEGRGSADDAPGRLDPPPRSPRPAVRAASVILGRRSAQRFDGKFTMSFDAFQTLLDALLPRPAAPWDVWRFRPRVHPILFVHRVEGLEPGLYALPRHPDAAAALRASLRDDFEWRATENAPAHIPLLRLAQRDCRAVARQLHCGQAIAGDACFALGLLAEFEPIVAANPWRYRQLHWEAGLVGHVLYLEAEASGLRGTGIGCFFDDDLHALLGLEGRRFQSLYHFTVGRPLLDDRISTAPAYPGRRQEGMNMRERKPYRRIDVGTAASLVGEAATLVLDVRDPASFAQAHIEGAEFAAYADLGRLIGSVAKSRPILIYCYHGNASQELAQAFSDFGFQNVYSLDGGYEAWAAKAPRRVFPSPALSRFLAEHGFAAESLEATIANRTTPLMRAAHVGEAGVVGELIAGKVALDARNADGNTALWFACVGRHLDIIDALAEAGADLDNRNDNGATALMYAASAGLAAVVERLLARGADPRPETLDGFSALDMAATVAVLELLRPARRRRVETAADD